MMIVFRLKWHLQVYLKYQSYDASVYIYTNKTAMTFDTCTDVGHMETNGKYLLQHAIIAYHYFIFYFLFELKAFRYFMLLLF